MQKLLLMVVAVFAATGCVTGTAPTAQAVAADQSNEMPHVKRGNFVVADIDRALTIYRDILGLTAGPVQPSSDDSYSYPVFKIPREAKMRFRNAERTSRGAHIRVDGSHRRRPPHAAQCAAYEHGCHRR